MAKNPSHKEAQILQVQASAAQAANYPFCTIEPNVGLVSVPDERLHKLAVIHKSVKVQPTAVEFVDIAGIVKEQRMEPV